jgi:hypothetical protein
MKYILLDDLSVAEIIPAEDPIFPDIPLEERYAPDFIAQLLPVEDTVEVEQNWIYDAGAGTFAPAPEPEPTEKTEEVITN